MHWHKYENNPGLTHYIPFTVYFKRHENIFCGLLKHYGRWALNLSCLVVKSSLLRELGLQ